MIDKIINKEKKEAVIRLFGVIGQDVDGNELARHISMVDDGVETISLLINSPGGSVNQGMSIITAIRTTKAEVVANVYGIAASMAAVIAVSADKVKMQDYAKLMIHDPRFGSDKDTLTAKDKRALEAIKDMLQSILSSRGCDKEKIGRLMASETWFGADAALAEGLIDEVITTPRKELKALTAEQLSNEISNEYKQPKKKDMKEIAKKLGLAENATEEQILAAIDAQAKKESVPASVINTMIEIGKERGVVTDATVERMKNLAKADFELFNALILDSKAKEAVEGGKQTPVTDPKVTEGATGRLSDAIRALANGGTPSTESTRDWKWYQKNDHKALLKMETEDPTKFKKLLDAYEDSL